MNKLAQDVRDALGDQAINDVTLESYDHVQVPANTLLLSLRSKVFREMLADVRERDGEEGMFMFPMDYTGRVIKSLVHFCYTDEVLRLGQESRQKEGPFRAEIESLIDLLNAAETFGMKELQRKLFPVICRSMAEHPSAAAFVICNVVANNAISWNIMEVAQKVIAVRPKAALTTSTLKTADISTISRLINPLSAEGNEEYCLTLLEKWITLGASPESNEKRRDVAKSVASKLKLDNLDPQTLGSLLDRGSVVTAESGLQAFRKQAETWKNGTPYAFVNARRISEGGNVVLVHGCGNSAVNGVYVFTDQIADNDAGRHYELSRKTEIAEEGDGSTDNEHLYVVEEDLAERVWYIRRGESDLLFKAPFESKHDETTVPFGTWEAEDEEGDCVPPIMLFVPQPDAAYI
jgi:hypothetical protein